MSQIIQLTLIKSLIIESVKNETYFSGQLDKADNDKAISTAYHEQAGNETYQERLLERALQTNLADLLTHFSDYLTQTGQSSGDNIIDLDDNDGKIIISLTVSDRFNKGYTDSIAKLSSKYIEECMLVDWWKPVNKDRSAFYAQFLERDLANIKRCFNKTAPVAPSVPYTTYLHLVGDAVELAIGEEATVCYELSDGAVDDIEVRVEDTTICESGRGEKGFTVKGKHYGHSYIELYSRHNPDIAETLHVFVTDHR